MNLKKEESGMNFRQFLNIKRIEKKRTLSKDAKDFNKTVSYLSIMENGKQPLSDNYKKFLCQTYNVEIDVLESYLFTKEVVFYYSSLENICQ